MSYKTKPQIKLYAFQNNAFVLQAIIDDFQEISFSHNLYEAGDFTISINYNIPNALKFERGLFVQFGDNSYMFGEILKITDAIGEDGKGSQIRTITGKDARYIFKRRIIKNLNNVENWAMTDKGELCLRNLIKDQCGSGAESKRQLPIINTIPASADAIGKEYSVAESFSNLYDTLVTIATQSEIGWRVKFNGSLILECYEGSDLSDSVQFSTDFDSLSNGQFTDSAEAYANSIYVGGKGTGAERDIYEGESAIGGSSPSGFDRYEAWDNQSSMTSESEYEAEALSMLSQYGQTVTIDGQGLAKCPYEFQQQYNIGDVITLAFSGKSAKAQILSVTEHWIFGQYGIEFTFGKPQNDFSRQMQLILKQIQKASVKTTVTESVKWYTMTSNQTQEKADVIYDSIGFTGSIGTGKTFTFYWDNEKTGAKTYNIYGKALSGTGKLTLKSSATNKATITLETGTYVAIVYVDAEGNVVLQSCTATPSVTSGNSQPVTSGGVADAIQNVTSLPTDAVLHYSFDDVPDYPDGMAVYYKNEDWSTIDSWQRFTTRGTISVENGILTSTRVDSQWATLERNMSIPAKSIIKIRIKDTSNTGIYVFKKTSSDDYTVLTEQSLQAGIPKEIVLVCDTSAIGIMIRNSGKESSMVAGKLQLEAIYIGNGNYSTPIIDNANGQWNSVSQSGVAVRGVSGKAYKCFAGQEVSIGNIALNTNFSVSIWVKPENTTSNLRGEILRGAGQLIIRNGENGLDKFAVYIWQSGNTATELISSDLLPANIWIHIVVVKNNNVLKVYKNGEQSNNFQLSSNILYQPGENYSVADNSNTRSQSYDDLLIFDRALSDTEVQALYLNKANTPKYYSWAHWKLSNT